jgi:DNA gyrase/topoisomerase IV subunit A
MNILFIQGYFVRSVKVVGEVLGKFHAHGVLICNAHSDTIQTLVRD